MNHQQIAENYVRGKLPEVKVVEMHHYLHALRIDGWSMTCEPKGQSVFIAKLLKGNEKNYQTHRIEFLFTTGQPATEADARAKVLIYLLDNNLHKQK